MWVMVTRDQKVRQKSQWSSVGLASAVLIVLAVAIVPSFHDTAWRKNEASAVAGLQKINEMEVRYAKAHPKEGFACELSELRGMFTSKDDSTAMLVGEWSGYKFAFVGCTLKGDGVATRYQIVAEPVKVGVSGRRAFCAESGGEIFYDEDGSGEACLLGRKVLE
jgi:hypothetical protein